MATYLKEEEIRERLDSIIDKYVKECLNTGQLNPEFIELIKHNFYAKYVYYDPATEMVEIGINESKERSPGYPDIKVYHYAISETRQWLGTRVRTSRFDLEFYAGLISREQDSDSDIFLLDREEED